MTRNLLSPLGALALALTLMPFAPAASAQAQPFQTQPSQAPASQTLVGTWSAAINWNLPSGIIVTTSFLSNSRIQSTIQNHRGQSVMLTGTYQYNAAGGNLNYTWQDYSPKQICVGGNCTPAPVPAPMGAVNTSSIRFLSATQFVATSNGSSTTYVRTNAAGVPTQ
jgi:hypothetical protein